MTPELVAILSVGVALLAVQVVSAQRTDRRIEGLETRIAGLEQQLESRMASLGQRLESRIASLEPRMAWLEGLLDGLREGLFERASRQN